MIRTSYLLIIAAMFVSHVIAQSPFAPSGQWTEKDVQKILNDSPWGQTQVETDTSEMMFSPTNDTGVSRPAPTSRTRQAQGATNQATSVDYHIMFLSAKPIREAISRRVELAQQTPNPALSAQLKGFVERNFDDYIVVAVTFDTKDPRFANAPRQAFAGALTSTIKNETYLDRSDGKRLFLRLYIPPSSDDLGAKFVFDRMLDGKPFLDGSFPQVRFYSAISRIKIDRKFRIAAMVYNGKLEY